MAVTAPQRRSFGLIIILILTALLSLFPILDQRAEADYDALFKRAIVTFALARTLNGVVSAMQGTEVALQPAGVGVTLTPGQLLDPVNDLIERFSWVMLGATISLGVQDFLLDVSVWWGLRIAVAVLAVALILLRWFKVRANPLGQSILLRLLVLGMFLRFAVPITLVVNDWLYQTFLESRYQESTQVIESAGKEWEQIGEEGLPEDGLEKSEPGLFKSLGRAFDNTLEKVNIKQRVSMIKRRAAEVVEHLIHLSVVFILQTGVLPIAFLWLFVELLKRAVLMPFSKPT